MSLCWDLEMSRDMLLPCCVHMCTPPPHQQHTVSPTRPSLGYEYRRHREFRVARLVGEDVD